MIQQITNEQIALSLADNRSRSPEETVEIAEVYYKWLEDKKGSPQDTPVIDNTIETQRADRLKESIK